jgi:hypothetical protein
VHLPLSLSVRAHLSCDTESASTPDDYVLSVNIFVIIINHKQKNKKENNQSSLFEIVIGTEKYKNKNDAGYRRL